MIVVLPAIPRNKEFPTLESRDAEIIKNATHWTANLIGAMGRKEQVLADTFEQIIDRAVEMLQAHHADPSLIGRSAMIYAVDKKGAFAMTGTMSLSKGYQEVKKKTK